MMDFLIGAIISAGLNAVILKNKGRSPFLGAILGFVLPILSILICWKMIPSSAPKAISRNQVRTIETSTKSLPGEKTFATSPKKIELSDVLVLPSMGYFGQEVAGESYHFAALKKITKILGGSGEHETIALLIPEPSNRYDKNAIRVEIEGLLCGYIPSGETQSLRPMLDYAAKKGRILGVNARVWSDLADLAEDEHGRTGDWIASVRLDMGPQFALAFPLNEPNENDVIWPAGSALKAKGTEDHMPAISMILASTYVPGSCSIYVHLEPMDIEGGKTGIGLFYDGKQLGQLSQASANKFLPVLLKVPQGKSVVTLCTVEGNSIAVQLTVDLLSPEKLTEDELKSLGL